LKRATGPTGGQLQQTGSVSGYAGATISQGTPRGHGYLLTLRDGSMMSIRPTGWSGAWIATTMATWPRSPMRWAAPPASATHAIGFR